MQSYVSLDKTVSCVVSWIFMLGYVLISVNFIFRGYFVARLVTFVCLYLYVIVVSY